MNHNFRKSNFYCAMMVLLLSYSAWAQSSECSRSRARNQQSKQLIRNAVSRGHDTAR
jgi:hypothetical protein